jgi:hypothetical protein
VVGLIAWLSGVAGAPREMSLGEFAEVFSLDTLPRGAVTFTAEHEAWLASGRSTTGGGRAP